MAGAISVLEAFYRLGIPFDTINALANTVTAVAVVWAARSLKSSLTEVRFLNLQPPFSRSPRLTDEQRERLWRDIAEERREEDKGNS